jgi:predicted lipid-binding transport protein (Tim44 family)
MNAQLDLLTLIALVVAAAAIFKLRSVLGHRSDEDDARVQRMKTREQEAAGKAAAAGASGDVINMPRRERSEPATAPVETISESSESRIRSFSAANPAAIDGLLSVAKLDSKFDPEAFLTGAGRAYEMIVTAFAQGDRKTLKDLLSRDVYDGFVTAIGERDGRGEKIEQTFVGIKKADIAGAEVQNGMALVTVRFVSELITALRGRDGDVISGDPQRVSDVTDVWTFSRDVSSQRALDNPNWKLEETQPPN